MDEKMKACFWSLYWQVDAAEFNAYNDTPSGAVNDIREIKRNLVHCIIFGAPLEDKNEEETDD